MNKIQKSKEELSNTAEVMLSQPEFASLVGYTHTTESGKKNTLTKLKFTKQCYNIYNFLNYLRHPIKTGNDDVRIIQTKAASINKSDIIYTLNEFSFLDHDKEPVINHFYPNDTIEEQITGSFGCFVRAYIIKRRIIEKYWFTSRNSYLIINALHSVGLIRKCKEDKKHIGTNSEGKEIFRSEGCSYVLTTRGLKALEAISFN